MFEVKLFNLGTVNEKEFTRVVCVSKYKGKYVFCYNKKRQGWEIPSGHIEAGETWLEAAKREMYEETGATKIKVKPISIYKINTYGLLCYCEIIEMGNLPKDFEMEQVLFSDELPENLSYPDSFKLYFETVKNAID